MTPAKPSTPLRFAAALATTSDTSRAVDEVCRQARDGLGAEPDLAALFVSHHHGPDYARIAAEVCRRTGAVRLLGCTGEAIVGAAREIEGRPAVSLWLASLPKVAVTPLHLTFEQTLEGGTFVGWPDDLPESWPDGSALLLFGEPFSFPADLLLERLNEDQPGVPVLGGMASGGDGPGTNRLLLGPQEFNHGAVAALVHGPVRIRSVVSQGCRPIGRHFVVTRADRNVILELGGRPPLVQLQAVFETLSARDRELVERGLHVGRAINEYQDHFERGDFLVRNCLGVDRQTGAIAIGDSVRPGQTVQFHIRDAQTADEDLRELLAAAAKAGGPDTLGALLFTCNGRGTRLFEQPHHDAGVLEEVLGKIPLAGFFAQGEAGPIGGKNFLHGFTASVALFGPS